MKIMRLNGVVKTKDTRFTFKSFFPCHYFVLNKEEVKMNG
jgi:hypothetical protein